MKVVKEQPFGFEFECRGCKSQLVAKIGDVRIGYFGANYGGDTSDREHNETTPKVREQANKTNRRRR